MKRLTSLAMQYKIYPIFMFIVSTLLAITVVVQNISIAEILNAMLLSTNHDLLNILMFTLVVLIARATFNTINQMIGNQMAAKVKRDLRKQLIIKQSKDPIGVQMNTLTESVDGIVPFFNSYFPQVFKSMMIPLLIIIAMCFVHLNTALIMMVTAPFIPLFYIIFGLKTRDESKDKMTYLNQFSQQFLNKIKGLITLKLFNRTEHTEKELYEESTTFRDLTMRILRSAFLSGLMLEFISMLGIGLVALEAGLGLILFHNLDFKTAAIAIILAPEFYNSIKDLGQSFHTGKQSEGSSDVLFEVLDKENKDPKPQIQINLNQRALIRLDQVYFKYKDSSMYALKDINLSIRSGEHIALIGKSGAGKSTLAQLIAQNLEASGGTITYKQKNLNIGFLSQAPYIFNASIRDNITMFHQVEEAQILQVLDDVELKEKVLSLKHGLDTSIGEGGEMLSGGQMRRIELSRILLGHPDLLIFDEPATGLDVKTENVIQNVIEQQFSNITMITIAHRAHTIKNADRRILIEQGVLKSGDIRKSNDPQQGGDEHETTN
ncbi:ABC transporter ATP-binding protein/permease [Staphylococcus pseudoxylosus]|uniref:ABC transporter ATP-binding protein/permease n=1 Tax=Staphylococcus pseudoxylosus TaxID=2282419 RepID=UPI000D1DBACF|nr:ABC transporter ATP-binding protein/permease [Staphylococcus pseudoxylosus]PTI57660.1 cysteine ABC transporter ATP-binding protein [Staphylococcus xylosus]MDW8799463.1 ABC transporter ATP-binding protein/permease [Staphylococcus pseudoxylosus]MEB6037209.1 ABC transporter ATP-binding protein/permease [Staphylococcus pseudoxylosus]MEB6045719.1 ABC transporter ATP-binding protein/permease [Staphylococcus pseudoxylosus]MEB7753409.1 ABC transporter ATP-binding protein/permease [Staphylococcus ps